MGIALYVLAFAAGAAACWAVLTFGPAILFKAKAWVAKKVS